MYVSLLSLLSMLYGCNCCYVMCLCCSSHWLSCLFINCCYVSESLCSHCCLCSYLLTVMYRGVLPHCCPCLFIVTCHARVSVLSSLSMFFACIVTAVIGRLCSHCCLCSYLLTVVTDRKSLPHCCSCLYCGLLCHSTGGLSASSIGCPCLHLIIITF
jgi:hypothetical protein